MRGLLEILATIVAGAAILGIAAYLLLGEAPPPVEPAAPVQQAGPGRPPDTPPDAQTSVAPKGPQRVPATADPSPPPATAAGPSKPAPEGYVAVDDVLAPARDVGGGVGTGAPPVRVGPIVRLQRAPEVKPTGSPEPAPVKPQRFFRVVIQDAGTIVAGRRTLRLAEVDVPSADAECGDAAGHSWSCGTRARTALRKLVRFRAVDCLPLGDVGFGSPDEAMVVSCRVGNTDLATWLVENGWASPADTAAPELAALGETARAENRGLWQTEPKGLDDHDPDDDPAEAAPGQ